MNFQKLAKSFCFFILFFVFYVCNVYSHGYFVTSCGKCLFVYDIETGQLKCKHKFSDNIKAITQKNGRDPAFFVGTQDGFIYVYDAENNSIIRTYDAEADCPLKNIYVNSERDSVIFCSYPRVLMMYNLENGICKKHDTGILSMEVSWSKSMPNSLFYSPKRSFRGYVLDIDQWERGVFGVKDDLATCLWIYPCSEKEILFLVCELTYNKKWDLEDAWHGYCLYLYNVERQEITEKKYVYGKDSRVISPVRFVCTASHHDPNVVLLHSSDNAIFYYDCREKKVVEILAGLQNHVEKSILLCDFDPFKKEVIVVLKYLKVLTFDSRTGKKKREVDCDQRDWEFQKTNKYACFFKKKKFYAGWSEDVWKRLKEEGRM